MFSARVEKDSISVVGDRLTTFVVEMPRVILAEVVTHRMNRDSWGYEEVTIAERATNDDISKNSGSSRAIPFVRMLEKVMKDPYIPEKFSKNGPGMQDHGFFEGAEHEARVAMWLDARDQAVLEAEQLHESGIHKQDVNRLLEPWMWMQVVLTSSRWDNFFALRCHSAAFPPFRKLARMMFLARRKSTPQALHHGQWHLPFIEDGDDCLNWFPNEQQINSGQIEFPALIRYSAARCAWVSYHNHDNEGTPEKMDATFNRLVAQIPKHASPLEHQATPEPARIYPQFRSNLHGWIQARKMMPYEAVKFYDPPESEIASWGIPDEPSGDYRVVQEHGQGG